MRRQRRGSSSGHEFGGSGEDSFVAVVVTKLTGALLFILLLTMVIMALIPKAVDQATTSEGEDQKSAPLKIATMEQLPEAIAGHPYQLTMATSGGRGLLRWTLEGKLPAGLVFDPDAGTLSGTPKQGTHKPVPLGLRVSDGMTSDTRMLSLVIYESDKPLTTPSSWKPGLPPIPWRSWAEHGYGFVVLGLVHLVGLNAVSTMQPDPTESRRRFFLYKAIVWAASLGSMVGLAVWLSRSHGSL